MQNVVVFSIACVYVDNSFQYDALQLMRFRNEERGYQAIERPWIADFKSVARAFQKLTLRFRNWQTRWKEQADQQMYNNCK